MPLERNRFAPGVTSISESVAVSGQGRLVFLSGQIAMGDDGALIEGEIGDQAAATFAQLERALMKVGGSRGDIAKLTVFFVDLDDLSDFDRARSAFFGDDLPASTGVQVDALYGGAKLEVEAIAFVEAGR